MTSEKITFSSHTLKISGVLELPDDYRPGERRAAIMMLHGFGSNKESGSCTIATRLFTQMGYVALRFDFRGCGESEGTRGKVICLEQVEDTRAAISYLA